MVLVQLYMNRLKHILRSRYLFKIIFLLSIIYVIVVTKCITYQSKYNISDNTFVVKVLEIEKDEDKISMLVKGKELLKATYYYKKNKEYNDIKLGDIIEIKGELVEPSSNTVPNTFNYKEYLYNKKIYFTLEIDNIKKIENNTSLIYYIKSVISNRINNITNSSPYLQTFILGDKSYMDDNINNTYRDNGISHLFSISGMHISLISGILFYLIKRISYNNYYNYGVVITFLLIYTFILGMIASVLRTIVMYILFAINKLFNLKIKNIDLMLFVLVICIIINPFIIYDIGFQYSYIISFTLIILRDKIKKINNYILKSLYISYIAFIVSFPITVYNFYQVNIISIFLNVIVIPLVSVIIFPLSIITFIFPFIDNLLYLLIKFLEFISINVDKIEFTKIIFSKPNILVIILYYILIYLSLYKQKYLMFLIMLVLLHKCYRYMYPIMNITFLDVGQGDSVLISFPYNKGNILIDTGGLFNSNYNISENKTIPYLKSIGITYLDYLIITHGDYDHIGEATNIIEDFKVKKVIFNVGKLNDLELDVIKILKEKNIEYYQNIKTLNIDTNILYFLNTEIYDTENDNSSVIYFIYNNIKFLLMGDAEVNKENDILKKYNLYNIDILKVGHHGSNTSSSKYFIDKINPEYSIISVGKNNRYGHPNGEVLNNLKDTIVYRTDEDGSIIFKIKNDSLKIDTNIT